MPLSPGGQLSHKTCAPRRRLANPPARMPLHNPHCQILEDMRIRGVKWDQRTVSSILNACAASGDPAFAEKIRSDAAEAGIETNAFMLAATMRAHTAHRGMVSRDRKLQKVREIVEESRSLGPEVGKVPGPVFDSLVACLVLLHENKEALRVYASRELEARALPPRSQRGFVSPALCPPTRPGKVPAPAEAQLSHPLRSAGAAGPPGAPGTRRDGPAPNRSAEAGAAGQGREAS